MRTCPHSRSGFTLVEVVLAIGVLSVAVLALIGLFGPTVTAVRDVVDADAVGSVVSKVNAVLRSTDTDPNDNEIEGMTFGEAFDFTASDTGEFFFFTSRNQNPDGSFDQPQLHFVQNNTAGQTYLQRFLPSSGNSDLIEGSAFLVVFQKANVGSGGATYTYSSSDRDNAGYVPIYITIFQVDPENLNPANSVLPDIGYRDNRIDFGSTENLTEADVLINYTTAKTR